MTDLDFLKQAHAALRDAANAERDPDKRRHLGVLRDEAWYRMTGRIVFELADGVCLVDGVPVHYRSRGVPIAWLVLAAHRHRTGLGRVEWFYPGTSGHRCAVQALRRAADELERVSVRLASVIRSIGTHDGTLVVRGDAGAIECVSPTLARAVRGGA
ncbi:MAG: hypothetical protein HZY77_01485 [Thiobacillus sp.]|uniref:hypothetical protein n=1 Tax=Thiobacillus sp. TaxID=924 RepID=UPI00168C7465|nr:hypothetical protein [Thiobacillus sp.]QLQ01736.1 MAG: hypothetical protein HZY77_01485 [Thiobacillus sp.]